MTANPYPTNDDEYHNYPCEKATETDDYWLLRFDGGTCFHATKIPGVTPRVGSSLRFYPGTLGSTVRGLFIDGQRIFYRTPAEQQERQRLEVEAHRAQRRAAFEANRATLDARFEALPEEFRVRIQRRRDHNPDFRWEYESYELFCCEEAVKLARACLKALAGRTFSAITDGEDAVRQWFTRFHSLLYAEQREIARLDDGHTGNTLGCACRLAYLYLVAPASVPDEYGALVPLVGSKAYGDMPPEEASLCGRCRQDVPDGRLAIHEGIGLCAACTAEIAPSRQP